jgi:2-dehydro-3-deoxyphosphogluconate aldolase/(4S)-4-hydroxy-2-oxoglutarate aldolase
MDKELNTIKEIKEQGLLPLFYHDDADICIGITKALYAAGIRNIEFTNRGKHAFENFKVLMKQKDSSMPGLLLGTGTIKTNDEASAYINAGADFLVSPIFDNGVCDVAYMNKIPWIPGCMTPTEIHNAQQAGCSLIKFFPGNLLGPGYVEAIMPLFNGLDFIVTGGVDTTEENIKAWFNSGVSGVGIGSKLITKKILEDKNYSELEVVAGKLLSIIRKIKS